MRLSIIIIINFLLQTLLLSTTWEIRQDGSGDFTTITAGITAAQTGDTILVYPGIYYERINYQGKNITITSLYDGDEYDTSYIANTVIDGNREGTVVIFTNYETRDAVLNGFTIRNGYGEQHTSGPYLYAGGIYIRYSSPVISNCVLEHNFAAYGSAFTLMASGNPLLKGNTIRYNHSIKYGAILTQSGTQVEFSAESLNNIYLNYGTQGCDLAIFGIGQTSVVVDTFTVLNPDRYFVYYHRENIPDFQITVNHGKIEPIATDLYVSPDGSDLNSGITPYEPLQTIAMAMIKIAPDSLVQRTVYVAEGIYSATLNNQWFPVSLREYIALVGADKETTILDGENEYPLLHAISHPDSWGEPIKNLIIKNFTLINGSKSIASPEYITFSLTYVSDFLVEDIVVTECHSNKMQKFNTACVGRSKLRNLHFYGNSGSRAISIVHRVQEYDFYAENIRVRTNVPDYYSNGGWGLGMAINSALSEPITEESKATIVNLELTDNRISHVPNPWVGLPRGNVEIWNRGTFRFINATIGNNSSTNYTGGGFTIGEGIRHVELINSIIYGNIPNNIAVQNSFSTEGQVYISHSLIQGGEDEIMYFLEPNTVVHWGEGNIDANPMWIGETDPEYADEFTYMLHRNSPAIDAGTLDIPDFEFPEYDLAGNPRISGATIDMGAYEYQTISADVDDNIDPGTAHNYNLHNYPNPVVELRGMGRGNGTGTNISFILPQAGRVVIDIYNLKGQFVRRLVAAHIAEGEHNAFWNGKDEQERVVATGFYMYRLEIDGNTVATGRCTFIK